MKHMSGIRNLVFFLLLSGCQSGGESIGSSPSPSVAVNELIDALNPKISSIVNAAEGRDMTLSSIELTLNTVVSSTDAGEIGILIFNAAASRQTETTSSFSILLEAPAISETISASDELEPFVQALTELIENARSSIGTLKATTIEGELSFLVVEETGGSIGGQFEIVPVSVKYGKDISESYTNTISVVVKSASSGNAL